MIRVCILQMLCYWAHFGRYSDASASSIAAPYSSSSISSSAAASNGLKWVRVNLPQYRRPGELAQLQCDYDLGNDTLYAVKWYKENEEFYRFVPKDRPQANSHKVEGVHIDMKLSDSRKVVLKSISLKTSGMYRCEVSAEAPSFASAQSEAHMEVVSLPKEDPTISGVQMQYQIGDEINLNCTSGKSHPASILHWYINDEQVVAEDALMHYPPFHHRHGLITSTLGLRFVLTNRHFRGGSMRAKCVASLSPLLWTGDKESVIKNLPIRDMREALLLVRGGCVAARGVSTMLILLAALTTAAAAAGINWTYL